MVVFVSTVRSQGGLDASLVFIVAFYPCKILGV